MLAELAKDEDEHVRRNVAANKNTPLEELQKLAQDKDDDVRRNVAGNETTPVEMLKKLAKDENAEVRKYAIKNFNFVPSEEDRNKYMMLGRLRTDCEYYLGYGNRSTNHLYYHDESKQIQAMKELYDSFPDEMKPVWITMEDIENYEHQMCYKFISNEIKQNGGIARMKKEAIKKVAESKEKNQSVPKKDLSR